MLCGNKKYTTAATFGFSFTGLLFTFKMQGGAGFLSKSFGG